MVFGGGARRREATRDAVTQEQQRAEAELAAAEAPAVETVATVDEVTPPEQQRVEAEIAAAPVEPVVAVTPPEQQRVEAGIEAAIEATEPAPPTPPTPAAPADAVAPPERFVVDVAQLPPGPAAGKALDPALAALVDSGASVKDILELADRSTGSFAGGVRDLLAPEIEAARALTGREQFNSFKSLGFVPEDAVFVQTDGTWGFTVPSEAPAPVFVAPRDFALDRADFVYLRATNPAIADVVTDEGINVAFRRHGDVLSSVRFERELQAISPELLTIFREQGVDAYLDAAAERIASREPTAAARAVLAAFGGDPAAAIEAGEIAAVRLLFSPDVVVGLQLNVAQRRTRDRALEALRPFINPETGDLRIFDAINADIPASTIRLAGYQVSQSDFNTLKRELTFVREHQPVPPSPTLRVANSRYLTAETAFSTAMGRIDAANPTLTQDERVVLYEQTPEYREFLEASIDQAGKAAVESPLAKLTVFLATVPSEISLRRDAEYVPLASIAKDGYQRAAFGAIDTAVSIIRGGFYTGAEVITGLPLFFLSLVVDPIGTATAAGVGAFASLTGITSTLSNRLALQPAALTRQDAEQLGSNAVILTLTALLLRGAYRSIPGRARLEALLGRVKVGQDGFIRLPGEPLTVIEQIRRTRPVTAAQQVRVVRLLRDIENAVAEKNQLSLYESARRLLPEAEAIGDPTLINFAKDIVNNPRAYIEGLEAVARTTDPIELAKKVEESIVDPGKKTRLVNPEDVGLTEAQFAEFIRLRVADPKLTVESFKESLRAARSAQWDAEVARLTEEFNTKLKDKTTVPLVRQEQLSTLLRQLKEQSAGKAEQEAKDAEESAAATRRLRERQTEELADTSDPELSQKIGDLNREMREELRRIKERAARVDKQADTAEEQIAAAEQALEEAEETGTDAEVAVATEALESLRDSLQDKTDEQVELQAVVVELEAALEDLETQLRELGEPSLLPEPSDEPTVEEVPAPIFEPEFPDIADEPETTILQITEPFEELVEETPPAEEPAPAEVPEVPEVPGAPEAPEIPEAPAPPVPPVVIAPTVPPRAPEPRKPTEPPGIPFGLPRGGMIAVSARVPVTPGSIAWKMGLFWKSIPPEDFKGAAKPRTLPLGVAPLGASLVGGDSPFATLQVIGRSRSPVPNRIAIDLGVVDIIIKRGRTIEFTGKGEQTDVGRRDSSTTTGMSVNEGASPDDLFVGDTSPPDQGNARRRPASKTRTQRRRRPGDGGNMTTLRGLR